MRLFGVHTSIRGGLTNVVKEAKLLGCTTFQIFLHSPRVWAIPEKTLNEVELFKNEAAASGFSEFYVHSSYLINLVSDRKEVAEKSINLLKEEVILSDRLGAKYYILHLRDNPRYSKKEILFLLSRSLRSLPNELSIQILIENTALGRIGSDAEEFSRFVRTLMSEVPAVSGVAVDSCHLFASGVNLDKPSLSEINKTNPDFRRLTKLLHLNDSRFERGSKKDRHEHLGCGKIGLGGLKAFLDFFNGLPVILETPKKSILDDRKNLSVLKKLLEKPLS
jgi:deoxyribonuclease-4